MHDTATTANIAHGVFSSSHLDSGHQLLTLCRCSSSGGGGVPGRRSLLRGRRRRFVLVLGHDGLVLVVVGLGLDLVVVIVVILLLLWRTQPPVPGFVVEPLGALGERSRGPHPKRLWAFRGRKREIPLLALLLELLREVGKVA